MDPKMGIAPFRKKRKFLKDSKVRGHRVQSSYLSLHQMLTWNYLKNIVKNKPNSSPDCLNVSCLESSRHYFNEARHSVARGHKLCS